MRGRKLPPWLAPLGVGLVLGVIFLRDTVPAWCEASEMKEERDRLAHENREVQEEIARYRLEKDQLQKSYFYNERIRRLLFQSGPEETKKK